jgi:hypothetical protein
MDIDYGVMIGFIATLCGAGVLGLSYMGAYFVGHSRGRREAELDRQLAERDDRVADQQRADAIQASLSSMAQAIERLTDAQRVALLDRVRTAPESRPARAPRHDTPA